MRKNFVNAPPENRYQVQNQPTAIYITDNNMKFN